MVEFIEQNGEKKEVKKIKNIYIYVEKKEKEKEKGWGPRERLRERTLESPPKVVGRDDGACGVVNSQHKGPIPACFL